MLANGVIIINKQTQTSSHNGIHMIVTITTHLLVESALLYMNIEYYAQHSLCTYMYDSVLASYSSHRHLTSTLSCLSNVISVWSPLLTTVFNAPHASAHAHYSF